MLWTSQLPPPYLHLQRQMYARRLRQRYLHNSHHLSARNTQSIFFRKHTQAVPVFVPRSTAVATKSSRLYYIITKSWYMCAGSLSPVSAGSVLCTALLSAPSTPDRVSVLAASSGARRDGGDGSSAFLISSASCTLANARAKGGRQFAKAWKRHTST